MTKWFGDSQRSECVKFATQVKVPLCSFTFPNHPSALDYIAAGYSIVPLLILSSSIFYGIIKRSMDSVSFLLLFLVHSPLTSIIKLIVLEDRPVGSCSSSCGMPSGHSFAAISTLTFLLLGYATASHPALILLAFALLFPVPWARVQLHDHSVSQVVIGSVLGFVWGIIWFKMQPWLTGKLKDLFSRFQNRVKP